MTVLDHPLIADRVTRLRDKDCNCEKFRLLLHNIACLMAPQVTAQLDTIPTPVQTPLEHTEGRRLVRPLIIVPVLRAGLSLAEGFLELIPEAIVAHIGLRRNHETLEPEVYYPNAPVDFSNADTIVLDPMLATGNSAAAAVTRLKQEGARRIKFVALVAAPEGIEAFATAHPDVPILTAAIDRQLSDIGYILPGLGDAGDRLYGTK